MQRIDGKALAAKVKQDTAAEVEQLRQKGIVPKLTVILVGDDPASKAYVGGKARDCEQCGIESEVLHLPDTTTEEELLLQIAQRNADPAVSGLLVQLPLPAQISEKKVIDAIDPAKDVDGFTPVNVGENATVTICHSKTKDLAAIAASADILVAAIGRRHFVTADMVKDGALVIDVGINRGEDGKLTGDVNEAALAEKSGYITPVPGGVGLMTRAMLMVNTVRAAKRQNGIAE